MPRAKTPMRLIGNARDRAKAFARRKAGLLKKARELAELCDVDVALVCCDGGGGGGGGAPVVWESDPGAVIDRYRRLPAEKRAKHTHLAYMDAQLSKEEGRLDKKRRQGLDGALACPGEAELEGVDLQALLASIDAALLATAERRKELGIAAAADDDGGGQQVSPGAAASVVPAIGQGVGVGGGEGELDDFQAWVDELMWDGVDPLPPLDATSVTTTQPAASGGVVQYMDGGNGVDMGSSSHQCQAPMLPPGNGENGQLPWHAYQYQPSTAVAFPDHGFQCTGNGAYVDTDEYSEMLMPSNANANGAYGYGGGWYDQASWGTGESSSLDAIAGNPAHIPPQHEHRSIGIDSFAMDAGGHGLGLADYYFQCPDAGQNFGAEPEPLHYLSDMAQGISYYDDLSDMAQGISYCDDDLLQAGGGCSSGTGRAQFFAQSHSCSGTPQFISDSEQSQSDVAPQYQYQDPGVQRFWVMEGPQGSSSTDVATDGARARGGGTTLKEVFTSHGYQFINRLARRTRSFEPLLID